MAYIVVPPTWPGNVTGQWDIVLFEDWIEEPGRGKLKVFASEETQAQADETRRSMNERDYPEHLKVQKRSQAQVLSDSPWRNDSVANSKRHH